MKKLGLIVIGFFICTFVFADVVPLTPGQTDLTTQEKEELDSLLKKAETQSLSGEEKKRATLLYNEAAFFQTKKILADVPKEFKDEDLIKMEREIFEVTSFDSAKLTAQLEDEKFKTKFLAATDRIKARTDEDLAKSILNSMSLTSENYAASHGGSYPSQITDLINATPPYINADYCADGTSGYDFHCSFSSQGYTFTATPISANTKTKSFTIKTGGMFSES